MFRKKWRNAPTDSEETMTRIIAREEIVPRFRRKSRVGICTAAEKSRGGRIPSIRSSGEMEI